MKEQDFPLYFSIIPDKGFNLTALEYHGYTTPIRFFTGVKHRQGRQGFDWKGVHNSSVQGETCHYLRYEHFALFTGRLQNRGKQQFYKKSKVFVS